MNIAVVIPSFYEKDGEYLKLCVESLRTTTDWQIIVVTNGTKDKPNLNHIKGISVHLHTSQQGQCNAVNIGVQLVTPNTDYIMVSNSDMYYAPGWNKNLRFNYPVFSPNLIEPENNVGSAPPFKKLAGGFTIEEFDREKVNQGIKDLMIPANLDLEPREETGFNLPFFIRKDVWETIGGYDIKYDPWGSNSDTDLQTKINLAGVTPMRLRDVLVYHFSNKSGTFDGTHQEEWQKNFDYYQGKWGYTRDDEPQADVWYNKNMILPDKLKYHPKWEGRYDKS
jgi:GT2 family glycosyltransferase